MIRFFVLSLGLFCLYGCASFGPSKVPTTRLEYNMTIQKSNNEEMLLNLVRLKYFEQPFFLQIGSISASFNYNITAGLTADVPDQRDIKKGMYSKYTPTIQGKYTDAPTITYMPSQGAAYAQLFLEEIDLNRLSILTKSGWDIGVVLQVLVGRIGKIDHLLDLRTGYLPDQDAAFKEFCQIMQGIDERNDLDLNTYSGGKDKPDVTMMTLGLKDDAEARRLGQLLGIDLRPIRNAQGRLIAKLHLVPHSGTADTAEADKDAVQLPIRLRNSLRALVVMAQGIEVPEKYLEAKRAFDLRPTFQGLCDIRSSVNRPADAFTTVNYQGFWYYIQNDDAHSKETFQLVLNIFSLQSADAPKNGPVLTLPVGAQ